MKRLYCKLFHRSHWEKKRDRFRNGQVTKVVCPVCGVKLYGKYKRSEAQSSDSATVEIGGKKNRTLRVGLGFR